MNKNKSIWNFFVNNYRVTFIIIAGLVILGTISALGMVRESAPDIDIPIAYIATAYPGASATDVETLVTDVIEKKLVNLDDVEDISSNSKRGLSSIIVQFNANSNSMEKISDLKDKVDEAKNDLPKEALDPIVKKISLDDAPILIFSLSGNYDIRQLKSYGDLLKDDIEGTPGVSEAVVVGGSDREVQVNINKASLDKFSLSILHVTQAIKQADSDIPIGVIETAGTEYNLRLAGRINDIEEVKTIPITSINGSPILVRDIAEVVDGYAKNHSISRLSIEGEQSQNAVSLQVYKVNGADTVNTIKIIREKIESAKGEYLPENISIQIVQDDAKSISKDLNGLMLNGIETVLIVLLTLILFLGYKEAILASLVIPFSYLAGLLILSSLGYTLNVLTLFALILTLGILVDSSIVIIEAIHQEIKKGSGAKKAVFDTIYKYKKPLMTGVLTTIFTFIPMIFVGGIMGKFIGSIPVTVTVVLLSSLFVSLGIVTTLSYLIFKKELKKKKETTIDDNNSQPSSKRKNKFKQAMNNLKIWYSDVLDHHINSKKKRKTLVITILFLFISSWSLLLLGALKVNMFPEANEDTFYIDLKEPIGTSLEKTNEDIKKIEEIIYSDDRIQSFTLTVGSSANSGSVFSSGSSDPHLAGIVLQLKDKRKEKSNKIVAEYQEKIKNIFDSKISVKVFQSSYGPVGETPVEIKIFGSSLDELENISKKIEGFLYQVPGTINIESSVQETNGEFVINIDRVKANIYGINAQQIATTLRNAIHGVDASSIKLSEGEDVDILVKYKLNPYSTEPETNNKIDISAVKNLSINTPMGEIPLSAFSEITMENNYFNIEHLGGDRVVKITSSVLDGYTASQIFKGLDKKIKEDLYIPTNYSISMGGEKEDINKYFGDLIKMLFVGIMLIIALLVWQFNSYRQVIFIITSIALSLIGVFFGLFLVGETLSMPSLIGIVALAGIVVNNAIILIDQINKNRKGGMDKVSAVKDAAESRLQPILLTTITTIAGILPLAISNPTWGPLGYSIIFGLAFSTVLTLLVIPLLYIRFDNSSFDAEEN